MVHCDFTQDGWRSQITTFSKTLMRSKLNQARPDYGLDLCVITALREPELQAVRDIPGFKFGDASVLDATSTYYEGGMQTSRGRRLSVVCSAAPRMGPVNAAVHGAKLMHVFKPRVVIMAGICAGVAGRSDLGDTILLNPVWDWQSGKYIKSEGERERTKSAKRQRQVPESRFLLDIQQLDVEPSVENFFGQLADDRSFWSELHNSWRGPRPANLPRGLMGPVASGSAVLADGATVERIKDSQNRKLIGIEMEAYGLYAAARASSPRSITFALKTVCDLGDPSKSDLYQDYSAHLSAATVFAMVSRFYEDFSVSS